MDFLGCRGTPGLQTVCFECVLLMCLCGCASLSVLGPKRQSGRETYARPSVSDGRLHFVTHELYNSTEKINTCMRVSTRGGTFKKFLSTVVGKRTKTHHLNKMCKERDDRRKTPKPKLNSALNLCRCFFIFYTVITIMDLTCSKTCYNFLTF